LWDLIHPRGADSLVGAARTRLSALLSDDRLCKYHPGIPTDQRSPLNTWHSSEVEVARDLHYLGVGDDVMSMTRRKRLQYAEKFFVMAQDFQDLGYYTDAVHYYQKSIRMYPTPEAYTHLAWAFSFLGEYDQAIEFCKVAISLDPDYGNPYNDIGAYLLEKGDTDQAIPYLRRAARARRYDQHHYAHFNLGRAWERKHQFDKAMTEYKRAVEMAPDYEPAKNAYHRLIRMMN